MSQLFSGTFDSLEQAKRNAYPDLFQAYGVFEERPGVYYLGKIREQEAVPVKTAIGVFGLIGYRLILYTDPVLCNWKAYMGPYENSDQSNA